jgi:menaquinone-dependent protoporphyrinogen IX oxidase
VVKEEAFSLGYRLKIRIKNEKICILYDTVSGSTAEIAEMLKDELSLRSCSITVISITKNCDLGDFDILIIGSPLRFGGFTSECENSLERISKGP